MGKGAYYNENDRQKAATLRLLIEAGAIAPGHVDDRPIQAVQPEDLHGFTQCHFFAGGGVWSHALRLAGWDDDRPIWTGSCPCGPFSVAGKKLGFEDPRHLWPEWFRLIGQCRPDVLFGEQSDDADAWVDLVSSDLEGHGYAVGTPDIPAAGFGGAHIRQRFYWVADAHNAEWWSERAPWHDGHWPKAGRVKSHGHAGDGGLGSRMADAHGGGLAQQPERNGAAAARGLELETGGSALRRRDVRGLGDATGWGSPGGAWEGSEGRWFLRMVPSRPSGSDWLFGRDGLWRPVEPGTCPLVDAAPARMGRLRLFGDAIDAEAAANFIGAYLDNAPAWGVAA